MDLLPWKNLPFRPKDGKDGKYSFTKMVTVKTKDHDQLIKYMIEKAENEALAGFVKELYRCLEDEDAVFPECDGWKEDCTRLDAIAPKDTPKEIFIGVFGSTGAGKSSSINVLVQHRILPTGGYGEAVTAVPTYIRYNRSPEPDKAFRGIIDFVSVDEIKNILTVLKDDVALTGGVDTECAEARKFTMIFPHLTFDDLATLDEDHIALQDLQKNFEIGGQKVIECGTADEFRKVIAPYISSDGHWEVIRRVTIEVKSELLEDGLTIVDFPGQGDVNAARQVQVEKAAEKLHGIIILAPLDRAVINEVGRKLLDKFTKVKEEVIGHQKQLEPVGIVYVMTKADTLQGPLREHFEQQPGLEAYVRYYHPGTLEKYDGLYRSGSEIENGLHSLPGKIDFARRKHQRLIGNLKKIASNSSSEFIAALGPDSPAPQGLDDKASWDWTRICRSIKTTQKEIADLELQHNQQTDQLNAAKKEYVEQHTIVASIVLKYTLNNCIEKLRKDVARSGRHTGDVDRFLHAKSRASEIMGEDYDVVCISINAFREMNGEIEGSKYAEGFLNRGETGVPTLATKFRLLDAKAQRQHSEHFHESAMNLMNEVVYWVPSPAFNVPITDQQRQDMWKVSVNLFAGLEKHVYAIIDTICGQIITCFEDELTPVFRQNGQAFARNIPQLAEKWILLGGSTFKAVCTRNGDFIRKNDQVACWPADVKKLFAQLVRVTLTDLLDGAVLQNMEYLEADVMDKIQGFGGARSRAVEKYCEPFKGRPSNMEAQIPALKTILHDMIKSAKKDVIMDACKVALDGAEKYLTDMLKDACTAAKGVVMGPGGANRMKDELTSWMASEPDQRVNDIMEDLLDKLGLILQKLKPHLRAKMPSILSACPNGFERLLKIAREANAADAKAKVAVLVQDYNHLVAQKTKAIMEDTRYNPGYHVPVEVPALPEVEDTTMTNVEELQEGDLDDEDETMEFKEGSLNQDDYDFSLKM